MQQIFIADAIKLVRKCAAPKRRHALDVCRSVGPAFESSTRVLPPQSSVKRSSGGRQRAAAQCRRRSLANCEYSSIGRYAVIGCKLQQYDNEGCKTYAKKDKAQHIVIAPQVDNATSGALGTWRAPSSVAHTCL